MYTTSCGPLPVVLSRGEPGGDATGSFVEVDPGVGVGRHERLGRGEEDARSISGRSPERGREGAVPVDGSDRHPGRCPARALVDVSDRVRVSGHLFGRGEEDPGAVSGDPVVDGGDLDAPRRGGRAGDRTARPEEDGRRQHAHGAATSDRPGRPQRPSRHRWSPGEMLRVTHVAPSLLLRDGPSIAPTR